LYNSCGGFELIIALAYHLGWPEMTANTIKNKMPMHFDPNALAVVCYHM
jgi:hypothetical protein